jgi:hypothetical protein
MCFACLVLKTGHCRPKNTEAESSSCFYMLQTFKVNEQITFSYFNPGGEKVCK